VGWELSVILLFGVLSLATAAVAYARLRNRVRELEVALQIASVEREHAETIIKRFSDSVASEMASVPSPRPSPGVSFESSGRERPNLSSLELVRKLKNDFVSSVSHELRTPLASIKAYVEMLIDGEAEDDKTKRDFYDVIQNEANRLSRLIDNILNVSKIESGLVQVNKQKQQLATIVLEAIDAIGPQARTKRVAIEEQLSCDRREVMADKELIYQAILNLLSNAVKFTPSGGKVKIETSVDEGRGVVCLRVTDSGAGIPADDLPFIFEKFYKVQANARSGQGLAGTGLGLALVRHIVEVAHEGHVCVRSDAGNGSCFEIELPLCGAAEQSDTNARGQKTGSVS